MIDYGVIDRATRRYARVGFDRVEVPWLVSRQISDITKPPGCSTYDVQKESKLATKSFVASAEQSFLYLIAKGQLPVIGKYQAITPCMRDEAFDETHVKYFMKCELITYWHHGGVTSPRETADAQLKSTIDDARRFFLSEIRTAGLGENLLDVVPTSQGYDIVYDGTEIGSYGVRRSGLCTWVYGTGVAEPRFSRVIRRKRGENEWATT